MKHNHNLLYPLSASLTAVLLVYAGHTSAQSDASHNMVHNSSMAHTMPILAPKEPGQGAFAAIQEIVSILESDSSTNWPQVNISALRQHLVDMQQLTINALVEATPIEGGLLMIITGNKRTLEAAKAMVPAHVTMIQGMHGWQLQAQVKANSVHLTVTAANANEISHIRGLGLFGIMATGSHHQTHHIGIARGQEVHQP